MPGFRSNGVQLSGLFEKLWGILKDAAADKEAGTVVCVIDGLDECEESGRTKLLRYLDHFYNDTTRNDRGNISLKFLITSRPYFHIERDLQNLISKYPVIRLSAEEETEAISHEINLVIKVEVQKLGETLKLDKFIRQILEEQLLKFQNRTYLWLHLILEVVRQRLETMSQKQIRNILSSVPETVDKAYSAILERSEDKESATKLLHIIVSAMRPLTLREMNTAMTIEASCNSYDDLDLVSEEKWKLIIRNLCGLFVTVVDSRVYLIHQTAREFLLFNSSSATATQPQRYAQDWKHSLVLEESNLILARICVWYLLFAVFEVEHLKPLKDPNGDAMWNEARSETNILDYMSEHPFLSYAAQYWAFHFREANNDTDMELLQSVCFRICNTQSLRFSNWFPVYWIMSKKHESYPFEIDSLLAASHPGLETVVQLLLKHEFKFNVLAGMKRTALSWVAEAGNVAVVKLLLEKCTKITTKDRCRNALIDGPKEYTDKIKSVFRSKVSRVGKSDYQRSSLPTAEPFSYDITKTGLSRQRIDINSEDFQSQTSLILAATNGHKRVVELLLEHKAKTDSEDDFGRTAAVKAADHGHEDIVILLLERTAQMKSKNKAFGSVLVSAAGRGQEAVVKTLLDRGVNKEFKNDDGRTALSMAASQGQPHVIRLLLEYKANIEAKDQEGNTPLMHAVQISKDSTVAFLLQNGANVEGTNKVGRTAISLAFIIEQKSTFIRWGVLGLLLEHGATMKSDHCEDVVLLLEAARKGRINVVRYLIEQRGLNIESRSESPSLARPPNSVNMTPLIEAAIAGQREMVEFLLEQNANIEALDNDGDTPLSRAAFAARDSVVNLLLENNANLESQNSRGETPLLRATQRKQRPKENPHELERVVKILLNHGANAEAKDNHKMTPLLWAITNGWAGVIKLLLEHNVKTDCQDQNGRTSWQLAEYIGEKMTIIHLLRHNVEIGSEQTLSRTPLSEAAEKGHESVVKQYIQESHDIESKDNIFGQSPLLWAAENGKEATVKILLECNADIESRNKYSQTALWLAVRQAHASMVKLLVERNATINREDNASRTPLQIARFHGHTGIEVLLENHLAHRNGIV